MNNLHKNREKIKIITSLSDFGKDTLFFEFHFLHAGEMKCRQ